MSQISKVLLRADHCLYYYSSSLVSKFYWQDLLQLWAVNHQQHWYWLLQAELSQGLIPFGCIGETELRQHFLRLPSFDYDRLLREVVDASSGRFLLWQRP